MATIVKQNLWDVQADVHIVTGNGMLKENGSKLVMGAGAAYEMRIRYPGIDIAFAEEVIKCRSINHAYGSPRLYGYTWAVYPSGHRLGILQAKYHYDDGSNLALIGYSLTKLLQAANIRGMDWTYAMNFPGIGLGGLKEKDVLPLLESIPLNLIVCKK